MLKLSQIIFLTVFFVPGLGLAMISDLKLQGQGQVNYLGFIKVYDAYLYTDSQASSGNILDEDTSRCLSLNYAVSLSADDFKRGANTILSRQHTSEKLAQMQPEIDLLHNAYRDVKEGDIYSLCYLASNKSTTLSLNQRELVTISSADFARVYFGIWLGPVAPIDKDLRDSLLSSINAKG